MAILWFKVFQTAFVGKAHATGRQCADTVLPTGFDCLTSAVIPAQAGIQTLAFKEYLGMLQFQPSGFPPARE